MENGWTQQFALKVAMSLAGRLTLHDKKVDCVSFRQNALFRFAESGLLIRIYSPFEDPSRAALMVKCARVLEHAQFPAVRLASDVDVQPLDVMGCKASVWQWLDEVNMASNYPAAFGQLLRRFHGVTFPSTFAAPSFAPLTKIRRRLARLAVMKFPDEHLRALHTVLNRCQQQDSFCNTFPGQTVLHGDALMGNAVASSSGVTLIDFDSVCFGPREWDLVPSLVSARRSGRNVDTWPAFLQGYGIEEEKLDQLNALRLIKELSMTVVLSLRHGENPAIDEEISERIRQLLVDDLNSPWKSLKQLTDGR